MGDVSKHVSYDTAGVVATALNIAANTLGAGLLSIPWCALKAGLLPGVVTLLLMGAMSWLSAMVLAKCCIMTGTFSYRDFGDLAFGHGRGWIVQVLVACYAMGSCITYVVLLGDFIPEALHNLHSGPFLKRDAIILYASVLYTSLSLLRDLSKLRFTSTAALCCILFTVGLLASRSASRPTKPVSNKLDMGLFDAVPILNVAWCFHYNTSQYFKELRDRSLRRFAAALTGAFLLCGGIYLTTMICGYLSFGSETEGDVIASFSDSYTPALVARGLLSVTITSVFPQAFHALRSSVYLIGGPLVEKLEGHIGNVPAYVLITFFFSAIATAVGIAVPKVEVVLGYKGSIFGSSIVYILPGVMYWILSSRAATVADAESRKLSMSSDLTELEQSLLYSIKQQHPSAGETATTGPGARPVSSMETIPLESMASAGSMASAVKLDSSVRSQPFMKTLCSANGIVSVALVVWGVVALILGTLKTAGVKF